MKRPALQDERLGVLGTAFRARKVFGTFEKRATGYNCTYVWRVSFAKETIVLYLLESEIIL